MSQDVCNGRCVGHASEFSASEWKPDPACPLHGTGQQPARPEHDLGARRYVRKGSIYAYPWRDGFSLEGISLSDADRLAGHPKVGGMVAINPDDPMDRWYIAPEFFAKHYAEGQPAQPVSGRFPPERLADTDPERLRAHMAQRGTKPAQRKCGCVYATSQNTESVRKGLEMGGYVKEFCAEHRPAQAGSGEAKRVPLEEEAIIESALRFSDSEYQMAFREGYARATTIAGRRLTAARQRIAALESELENERARGIHTCHDQCQRPLCVAQRRIAHIVAVVNPHIADLARVAAIFREHGMHDSADETEKAISELRTTLKDPT